MTQTKVVALRGEHTMVILKLS